MNALALLLTPSISSNEPFLIMDLLWRGRGSSLKSEWKQTGGEKGRGGVKLIFMLTLWKKIAWFFKQQKEFCVKTLPSFMLSLQKNNSFVSFHCSFFHSKKFLSILRVKWTGMNKGEQVENLWEKFGVNMLFERPQSIFAATKRSIF